jgi:hypothetical protein
MPECFRQNGKGRLYKKWKIVGTNSRKYLKTKEITFSNAANSTRFARSFAQFTDQKDQKHRIFRKRTETSEWQGKASKVTECRLRRGAGAAAIVTSAVAVRGPAKARLLLPLMYNFGRRNHKM